MDMFGKEFWEIGWLEIGKRWNILVVGADLDHAEAKCCEKTC